MVITVHADIVTKGLGHQQHYGEVIMGAIASQITSLTIGYTTVYSDADQRKHQSSASLAFVRGIHRGPVNSPHKWPVTRKMFPFDDVIMGTMRTMKVDTIVLELSMISILLSLIKLLHLKFREKNYERTFIAISTGRQWLKVPPTVCILN